MDRKELAGRLVSAENAGDRLRLLEEHTSHADTGLAYKLKEICYETWNNEPVKARAASDSIAALASICVSPEIDALACWVSGISELTKGEVASAVRELQKSVDGFASIGKRYESAQASVASLIPLALLGRYEEAVSTGLDALKIFEEEGDLLAAGKIELNLSNISSRRGDLREAERYGISARNRFIKAGETEWQALAENDLAHTYTELNDFRKAEEHYATALDSARSAGMKVTEAEIEASLGNLATFRGRYDEALRLLEHSRRKFEELEMPHQSAIAELEIAEIYQTLNLLEEAVGIQQKAAADLSKLGLQSEEARSRSDLGRILLDLGRLAEAGEELRRSAQLFEAEGNPYRISSVLIDEARIESLSGRDEEALKILDQAARLAGENIRLALEAAVLRGETLRRLGRFEEAAEVLRAARLEAMDSDLPKIGMSAVSSLGLVSLDLGDYVTAEREFSDAVSMIESMREPIAAEEFRMAYLADKLAPYDNLTRIYLAAGRIREAFEMVERARSRTLAESVRKASAPDQREESSQLAGEVREIREDLNWFYSRLNRADEGELEGLRQEIADRERRLSEASRRLASTASHTDRNGFDLSVDSVIGRLGPGRALVEFIESEGVFSAFVVTSDGIDHVDALATSEAVSDALESLQFQFGSMRYGGDAIKSFGASLKSRADACLSELYEMLIRPLEGAISDKDLIVVPSGALNYVPFHALYDGVRYEAEKREIVTAPGAGVWEVLASRDLPEPSSALVIGYADENIPNVEDEVAAVAGLFANASVFTATDATFGNYVSRAPGFPVIHLACHGRFRPENPLFSSLHLSDGFITVRDICAQNINAALVTLSACETGLNRVYPGSEILGLARGFLAAGAARIVLSLWTVDDESTARLMGGMYRGLQRGLSVSASLNLERIKMIGEEVHPYFWAPFGIIGRH